MTKEEIQSKFREFASLVLFDAKVDEVIETIRGLEAADNIRELGRLLVAC